MNTAETEMLEELQVEIELVIKKSMLRYRLEILDLYGNLLDLATLREIKRKDLEQLKQLEAGNLVELNPTSTGEKDNGVMVVNLALLEFIKSIGKQNRKRDVVTGICSATALSKVTKELFV